MKVCLYFPARQNVQGLKTRLEFIHKYRQYVQGNGSYGTGNSVWGRLIIYEYINNWRVHKKKIPNGYTNFYTYYIFYNSLKVIQLNMTQLLR